MTSPMTKEEAEFAEKNHKLVLAYLSRNSYCYDDYYDIVIFGYLKAVCDWHRREELRDKYKFSTLAFTAMRTRINGHFVRMNRKMRSADTCQFNDRLDNRHTGSTELEDRSLLDESIRRAISLLSPRQQEIARLRAAGLNYREIGDRYGVTHERVRQILLEARGRIERSPAYIPEFMTA